MIISLQVRGERIDLDTGIDINTIPIPPMVHERCGGTVIRTVVTEPYAALHCKTCGLRVLLPQTVRTVDDLERWALSHIS